MHPALFSFWETATALNFLTSIGAKMCWSGETVKWGRLSSSLFRVGQRVCLYCVLSWLVKELIMC